MHTLFLESSDKIASVDDYNPNQDSSLIVNHSDIFYFQEGFYQAKSDKTLEAVSIDYAARHWLQANEPNCTDAQKNLFISFFHALITKRFDQLPQEIIIKKSMLAKTSIPENIIAFLKPIVFS